MVQTHCPTLWKIIFFRKELWLPHPWECSRQGCMGLGATCPVEAVPACGWSSEQDDLCGPSHPKPFSAPWSCDEQCQRRFQEWDLWYETWISSSCKALNQLVSLRSLCKHTIYSLLQQNVSHIIPAGGCSAECFCIYKNAQRAAERDMVYCPVCVLLCTPGELV